jgi:hypothetical protein
MKTKDCTLLVVYVMCVECVSVCIYLCMYIYIYI